MYSRYKFIIAHTQSSVLGYQNPTKTKLVNRGCRKGVAKARQNSACVLTEISMQNIPSLLSRNLVFPSGDKSMLRMDQRNVRNHISARKHPNRTRVPYFLDQRFLFQRISLIVMFFFLLCFLNRHLTCYIPLCIRQY
jgi:hypothetical protein